MTSLKVGTSESKTSPVVVKTLYRKSFEAFSQTQTLSKIKPQGFLGAF
jgi:hypothetical protein